MTTPTDPTRRQAETSIEVRATPEQVWDAIATTRGISAWFVPADVEEGAGGSVTFHLGPGMDSTGTVAAWEPPARVAYREPWTDDAAGASIATEFLVEAKAGGTCVVRVVSTFSEDGHAQDLDSMNDGWAGFLPILQLYVEGFAGEAASTAEARAAHPGDAAAAWQQLASSTGIADAAAGDAIRAFGIDAVVVRTGEHDLLARTGDGYLTLGAVQWDGDATAYAKRVVFGPQAPAVAAAVQDDLAAALGTVFLGGDETPTGH